MKIDDYWHKKPSDDVLWTTFDDVPITNTDVNQSIINVLSEINQKTIEFQWISHPKFREYIILQGRANSAYPSTIIAEIRRETNEDEMKYDIQNWNK